MVSITNSSIKSTSVNNSTNSNMPDLQKNKWVQCIKEFLRMLFGMHRDNLDHSTEVHISKEQYMEGKAILDEVEKLLDQPGESLIHYPVLIDGRDYIFAETHDQQLILYPRDQPKEVTIIAEHTNFAKIINQMRASEASKTTFTIPGDIPPLDEVTNS